MAYAHKLEEPLTPHKRMRLAAAVVVVLIVVTLGFGFVKYFRLSGLDDYRTGYALGSVWAETGVRDVDCQAAMEALYPTDTNFVDRDPGWGEFRVGCEDGASGASPAPWYGLRDRLWDTDGFD